MCRRRKLNGMKAFLSRQRMIVQYYEDWLKLLIRTRIVRKRIFVCEDLPARSMAAITITIATNKLSTHFILNNLVCKRNCSLQQQSFEFIELFTTTLRFIMINRSLMRSRKTVRYHIFSDTSHNESTHVEFTTLYLFSTAMYGVQNMQRHPSECKPSVSVVLKFVCVVAFKWYRRGVSSAKTQ